MVKTSNAINPLVWDDIVCESLISFLVIYSDINIIKRFVIFAFLDVSSTRRVPYALAAGDVRYVRELLGKTTKVRRQDVTSKGGRITLQRSSLLSLPPGKWSLPKHVPLASSFV